MEDIVRLSMIRRMTLMRLNNNYFQYSQGLMTEDYISILRQDLLGLMNLPIFRVQALNTPVSVNGFRELILEVNDEILTRD